MSQKVIVCRCEDVTVKDLEHAVALGYGTIEEVKRYTGIGTGLCQGKECQALACRELARLTGRPAREIEPFTTRPPLEPVSLAALARAGRDEKTAADEKKEPVR